MQVELHVRPSHIEAVVEGDFSLSDSRAWISRLAEACEQARTRLVLIDSRKLRRDISLGARFDLAEHIAATLPHGVRVAILSSAAHHRNSKVLENTANNRGANVLSTEDRDEALRFLGLAGDSPAH